MISFINYLIIIKINLIKKINSKKTENRIKIINFIYLFI